MTIPDTIRAMWEELRAAKEIAAPEGFVYHEMAVTQGPPIGYQTFTPRSDEALPLVLFMAGTHHANNETNDKQLRNPGCHTLTHPDFPYPCHVIAPWNATEGHPANDEAGRQQTLDFAQGVKEIIEDYIAAHSVDTSRIYYIGVGGGGKYQIPAACPQIWAAIAMNTSVFDYYADGSEDCYLEAVQDVPVYLSHGVCDKPNPVRRSRKAYQMLLDAGNKDVVYKEYTEEELQDAGADLDTFDGAHSAACALPFYSGEFYDFIFSKRRPDMR